MFSLRYSVGLLLVFCVGALAHADSGIPTTATLIARVTPIVGEDVVWNYEAFNTMAERANAEPDTGVLWGAVEERLVALELDHRSIVSLSIPPSDSSPCGEETDHDLQERALAKSREIIEALGYDARDDLL